MRALRTMRHTVESGIRPSAQIATAGCWGNGPIDTPNIAAAPQRSTQAVVFAQLGDWSMPAAKRSRNT
jgi:hypothetical protein